MGDGLGTGVLDRRTRHVLRRFRNCFRWAYLARLWLLFSRGARGGYILEAAL
jgi:hypothetical protein